MQLKSLKEIANIFREVAGKIENNTCEADIETLTELSNRLIHIKLTVEETCNFLNCSRATLKRMVIDGRVPKPRKTLGGKEYWYRDELEDYISAYKEKYNL